MGLILRSSSLANGGNTVSVKGSALSYIEGDGNFVYLLTNMSGSNISITGSTSITGNLTVLGGITGSFTGSLTGSLFGTSSFATVAQTASSADNFNVRNTLTVQTIVAQVVTSSTDFVTGSSKFGSIITDTHQFTGSVSISGSLIAQSITGSVTGSVTGSLFGTSSFATVAQTASSADNFNVRNTLTATTIVVQTITSSVDFVTGSTRFGSNITNNTHTFTGSLLLTGSLIATGSVDITGSTSISGLFTVSTGSSTELQVTNTGVKIGNAITDIHTITGSLSTSGSVVVTGSFTVFSGSLIDFQVTDTGTIKGNLVTDIHIVTGSIRISGSSHTTTGNLALTGSQALSGSLVIDSGSIRVASGSIFTPKVLGNTATPVMAAGTGAGSGPTISISGSDVAGYIRVLTGTGPAVKNEVVTITFASAYSSLPYVLVTPASYSSSLALGGVSGTFTTASTTGFTMFSGDGALRGATAYTWSYHVFG